MTNSKGRFSPSIEPSLLAFKKGRFINIDPAILLPSIYSPKKYIHSDGKILIIPDYNDYALINKDILKYEKVPHVTLLHPYILPLTMIDLIPSAKAVITLFLHAKTIADSYKIPNTALSGSDFA